VLNTIAEAEAEVITSNLGPACQPQVEIPDTPLFTIRAGRRRIGADLLDLWTHRELFYFLTWRDVKVRYKQTVLGASWAILQPFLTMVIFTLFFGKLAKIPSDGIPYPIFAYAGLLPWTFFSNAVTSSGNSLVGNSSLITKVYFPRMIIPGSAVAAALLDFAIAGVILLAMMAYYGVALSWQAAMLAPLILLVTLLAVGVGTCAAGLNVKYRDVRHALPFCIQLWMFATPIIYPSSFVPAKWRWILALNPLTGTIEGFRSALFGLNFNWSEFAVATCLTALVVAYSVHSFRRMEREFADIV
jgi:homopolymeric O-antigen transport system permease protein